MIYSAHFNHFTIALTGEQVRSIPRSVPPDTQIAALVEEPGIKNQLDALPASWIRDELGEYGAWDDEELADERANRARIVWLATCDLRDENNWN